MTALLREPRPGAVRASRAGAPRWARLARGMAIAAAIGAFLAFIGAFGTNEMPLGKRTALMVALSWAGGGLGFVSFRLAQRLPGLKDRRWTGAVVGGLLMAAPMGLVVFAAVQIAIGRQLPLTALPGFLLTSLVTSVALSVLAVALSFRAEAPAPPLAPGPPRFLERLPLKLRGGELWAVESEDHYLRLHTSKGQDLILLRLADAVAELDGVEGMRVHRSWWVARAAVEGARRGDGRATLTLKDGSLVPVSRTYARMLREKGWI